MKPLRVLIHRASEDWFEAQLLDLDIAVASATEDGLFRELEHALELEYRIARRRGETPFASIAGATPPHFEAYWNTAADAIPDEAGQRALNVSPDAQDALAIALHSKGGLTIQVRKTAA